MASQQEDSAGPRQKTSFVKRLPLVLVVVFLAGVAIFFGTQKYFTLSFSRDYAATTSKVSGQNKVSGQKDNYASQPKKQGLLNLIQNLFNPSVPDGVIEVIHFDPSDMLTNPNAHSRTECYVNTGGAARHRLSGQCDESLAGQSARWSGSGYSLLSHGITPVSPVVGTKTLAVILVNFTDDPSRPFDKAEADKAIFSGSSSDSVADRYFRSSYGKLLVTGQVFDWVTIDPPKDDRGNPWTDCGKTYHADKVAKEKSGADGFDYYTFIFPAGYGCSVPGYGQVFGNKSWILGNISTYVIQHELGHNFGLAHSSFLRCPQTNVNIGSCAKSEYGDPFDVMGGSWTGDFHNDNKNKLGWLDGGIVEVTPGDSATTRKTYVLAPIEQGSNIRGLTIPIEDGTGYFYNIEYRCCGPTEHGLVIRLIRPYETNSSGRLGFSANSILISADPNYSTNSYDTTNVTLKQPGQVFYDPVRKVRIVLESLTPDSASFQIRLKPTGVPTVDVKGATAYPPYNLDYLDYGDGPLTVQPFDRVALQIGGVYIDSPTCVLQPLDIHYPYGIWLSDNLTRDTQFDFTCKDEAGNAISDRLEVRVRDCQAGKVSVSVPTVEVQRSEKTITRITLTNRDTGSQCDAKTFTVTTNYSPDFLIPKTDSLTYILNPGESQTQKFKIKVAADAPLGLQSLTLEVSHVENGLNVSDFGFGVFVNVVD